MDKPEVELKIKNGEALVSLSAGRSRLIARGRKDAAHLATTVAQDSPVPISKSRVKRLADQGDSEAQWEIGWVYSVGGVTSGGYSVPCGVQCTGEDVVLEGGRDFEEAARWFRKAAEQGLAAAQSSLGDLYKRGEGVPKNSAEAAVLHAQAAEQGYPAAQFELGIAYETGEGIGKDDAAAVNWYRNAADNGYHLALFKMGVLYSEGNKVRLDYGEAARCFQEAGKRGLFAAYINLGLLYADGKGVAQNEAEAVRLYLDWRKRCCRPRRDAAVEHIREVLAETNDGCPGIDSPPMRVSGARGSTSGSCTLKAGACRRVTLRPRFGSGRRPNMAMYTAC